MEKYLLSLTVSGNTIHHGRVGRAAVVASFVILETIGWSSLLGRFVSREDGK